MNNGDIQKIIKQTAKEVSTDVKRQMGAYKEEMKKYVDVALNQTKGLGEKLDRVEKSIDRFGTEMRGLKLSVEKLKHNIDIKLYDKVDMKDFMVLEERVTKIEKK